MGRALSRRRRLPGLTFWILAGMAAGIALGIAAPSFAASPNMKLVANVFLRLIRSIIAPLIFGTLVAGIAATGSVRVMGRIGLKALIFFEAVTTLALFVGLGAVNLVRPGAGVQLQHTAEDATLAAAPAGLGSMLEHTFPASIVDAMARGEVLQIVVFSFLFGAACAAIGAKAKPVVDFCNALAEIMFRYTNYVMYFAPVGVAAAMAWAIGSRGAGVLVNLGKLILTLYGTLIVFGVVVFGAVLVMARIPIRRFLAAAREPFLIAFSTASSEAALPQALENMEDFGVPQHIVAFVLPAGYSFNLVGSTLYLSLAAMFVAQAGGIQLSLGEQLTMMLTLLLTSKGVAGVPRAALVILAATVATFHLPIEGVAVLLAIDTIMDMVRTSVNVLGNCLASAVVAKWEGVRFGAGRTAAATLD